MVIVATRSRWESSGRSSRRSTAIPLAVLVARRGATARVVSVRASESRSAPAWPSGLGLARRSSGDRGRNWRPGPASGDGRPACRRSSGGSDGPRGSGSPGSYLELAATGTLGSRDGSRATSHCCPHRHGGGDRLVVPRRVGLWRPVPDAIDRLGRVRRRLLGPRRAPVGRDFRLSLDALRPGPGLNPAFGAVALEIIATGRASCRAREVGGR